MPAPELVLWPIVGVTAIAAAIFDLRGGRAPLALSVTALLLLLVSRAALGGVGSGLDAGLVSGLLGALGCAGPFSIFAVSKRAGWSDVLLLAAVGAGFGVPRALAALLLISIVGAVGALFFVVIRRRGNASVASPESKAAPRAAVDSTRSIPYGVPIALGALWAMGWAGPAVPDVELAPEVEVEVDGGVPAESFEQPVSE